MFDDKDEKGSRVVDSQYAAPLATASSAVAGSDHTALPWVIDEGDYWYGNVYSSDRTGSIVATCKDFQFAPRPRAEVLANARFIVQCVNSHAELIAALKECADIVEGVRTTNLAGALVQARAALAKVGQ